MATKAKAPTDGPESSRSLDDPGERAVRFFNNLTHTGDYSGQPFRLRPWQEGPIRKLFGTLRPDGTRQYRKVFQALPRKQGKTETIAAGGLFLLLGQRRRNQRIYTASGDTDQAKLIFDAASEMIRNDPVLTRMTDVLAGYKEIRYPDGNSFLKVLSSVPASKHGLGPTAVLLDEYHVIKEELVNVLTTGFAARRDPLTWMITTAGWDRTSICWEEWEYARDVHEGRLEDPSYLPIIYAAEPDDDWNDERVWHKAMPALGDFCSLDFIREEYRKARERPRFQNTFRQLYLNQWTEQATRWLDTQRWSELATLDASTLDGRDCYAGFDAGVTGDMSSLAMAFPNELGGFDFDWRYWVPRDGRWKQEARNSKLYPQWEQAGFLTFTEGESTDFDQVENDIAEMNARRPFRILCADRAYASQILSRLFNVHGINVKAIGQGPVTMNEPMVRFESMVLDREARHDGNPIAAWNVANATAHKNSTGLLHLDKSAATSRIDGLAAALDAVAGSLADESNAPPPYNERGLIFI
jgi:phage terminase large subunit-like protein